MGKRGSFDVGGIGKREKEREMLGLPLWMMATLLLWLPLGWSLQKLDPCWFLEMDMYYVVRRTFLIIYKGGVDVEGLETLKK